MVRDFEVLAGMARQLVRKVGTIGQVLAVQVALGLPLT
jgi:hypothetical protein